MSHAEFEYAGVPPAEFCLLQALRTRRRVAWNHAARYRRPVGSIHLPSCFDEIMSSNALFCLLRARMTIFLYNPVAFRFHANLPGRTCFQTCSECSEVVAFGAAVASARPSWSNAFQVLTEPLDPNHSLNGQMLPRPRCFLVVTFQAF